MDFTCALTTFKNTNTAFTSNLLGSKIPIITSERTLDLHNTRMASTGTLTASKGILTYQKALSQPLTLMASKSTLSIHVDSAWGAHLV